MNGVTHADMAGGGIAAFDCNDDGYPDLAFAGGEGMSSFYVNKSEREIGRAHV